MAMWEHLTNLGGINVLGVVALAIALWLLLARAWRLSWWWCVLFGGGLVLVVATKLAFIGWGFGIRAIDFTGLSGHAMRAMAVFPVVLYLVLHGAPSWARRTGVVLGVLLGLMISVSRLMVHAHSVSEVVLGGALGLLVGFGFLALIDRRQKFVLHGAFIVLSLLSLLISSRVPPTPTHGLMVRLALYVSGHERPFVREGWRYDPYFWVALK
jgi:membrane-associated phospholipid phosphatase